MTIEQSTKNHRESPKLATPVKTVSSTGSDTANGLAGIYAYSKEELSSASPLAYNLACGCDNPLQSLNLQPNLSVVDLGCGGGLDVILAAQRVGQEGRVFGIDIDEELLNQARVGVSESGIQSGSIKFYNADIESSKLPKSYADIVISNCTINLCPNKEIVLKNIFRILRPGAILIISDIVFTGKSELKLQKSLQTFWQSREAQIMPKEYYINMLDKLSFTEITIGKQLLISKEILELMGYYINFGEKAQKGNLDSFHPDGSIAAITLTAKRPPLNC